MADIAGTVLFSTYRIAGTLLQPAAALVIAARWRRGKEDPARVGERKGRPSGPRPPGPLVWVHAASVGETMSVLPVIERIVGRGQHVLLTTGTVTSAGLALKRLPRGAVHQYVPLDVPAYLRRFLDHWRPDLALFVESELWPGMVAALHRRQVPQVLLNARMSERSFRRWQRAGGFAKALLGRLALCLAQSTADAERFRALVAPRVAVPGNLKFDGAPLPADERALASLRAMIGARPVWLGASTHPGEETLVLETHCRLAATIPDLLTIVVPRHPERGPAVRALAADLQLGTALRSENERIDARIPVYVADTIGELGLFYRLAPVAWLGGSLARRGGQNPIEPARLGTAFAHGPHVSNFAPIYAAFAAAGAAELVSDAAPLAAFVARLLADESERARRADAARRVIADNAGALDRTLAALGPFLDPLAIRAGLARAGSPA